MNAMTLTLSNISKQFNRRSIFSDISFTLANGESLAITGRNGSGKSTLVKIVCGLLSPTGGTVEYSLEGKTISDELVGHHIGLVSPYLQLYDEFTGAENLELLAKIRSGRDPEAGRVDEVLSEVGLWERRRDFVRTYSSGMKQRLKYAFAVMHHPDVLILDEPTSNLDSDGIGIVKRMVSNQLRDSILLVATNDAEEANWCARKLSLSDKS